MVVYLLVVDFGKCTVIFVKDSCNTIIKRNINDISGLFLFKFDVLIAIGKGNNHLCIDALIITYTLPGQATDNKHIFYLFPCRTVGQIVLIKFLYSFFSQIDIINIFIDYIKTKPDVCRIHKFKLLGCITYRFAYLHHPSDSIRGIFLICEE